METFAATRDIPACKDRFMICGNPEMLRDLQAMVEDLIFVVVNNSTPTHFVMEHAVVSS